MRVAIAAGLDRFECREELRQRYTDPAYKAGHTRQREITRTTLDIGEVGAVHLRSPGKFFLGDPESLPVPADSGTETFLEGGLVAGN